MKKWHLLTVGLSFAGAFLCLTRAGAQGASLGNWSTARNDAGHAVSVEDLLANRRAVDERADRHKTRGRADDSVVGLAGADLLRGGRADVEPHR